MYLSEVDPVRLGPTGLPVLSAWDVAIGHPVGSVPLPPRPAQVDPDPARALRDALRPALLRPPCLVAFSGGRDSSLLLAVAAELAAREGMQPPTALTFRYPGDPAADETSWQELVVAHLHSACLRFEWVRRDITTELDNIGPVMAPVLRAHSGPTFPAGLANTILLAQHASGGSLVTGNAGDEVLGGHRAGVLRAVLRRRGRGLTRANWRQTAACAAPAPLRRRRARRDVDDALWLRPVLHRAVLAEWMRSQVARPLRWDRSVWSALAPRAVLIGNRTRARVAQDHDCELTEPLGSPGFVASYAAFGGRWGGITRAAGTRLLAAGLLPDAVIGRRQKAYFIGASQAPARRTTGRLLQSRSGQLARLRPAPSRPFVTTRFPGRQPLRLVASSSIRPSTTSWPPRPRPIRQGRRFGSPLVSTPPAGISTARSPRRTARGFGLTRGEVTQARRSVHRHASRRDGGNLITPQRRIRGGRGAVLTLVDQLISSVSHCRVPIRPVDDLPCRPPRRRPDLEHRDEVISQLEMGGGWGAEYLIPMPAPHVVRAEPAGCARR